MFKRDWHNQVLSLLQCFNEQVLLDCQCYFGGGTAISMLLDEYRESVDIDFLCSSVDGYGTIRSKVSKTLGELLNTEVTHVREVRTSQHKVTTVLRVGDTNIKVEIIHEGRIQLAGGTVDGLPVPVLSRESLFAEKLLANADRCLDASVRSRDIIDLAMMMDSWGGIPEWSWRVATTAYKTQISKAFHQATAEIARDAHFKKCLDAMAMDMAMADKIRWTVETAGAYLPLSAEEETSKHSRIEVLMSRRNDHRYASEFWRLATAAQAKGEIDWYEVELDSVSSLMEAHPTEVDAIIEFATSRSPACASRHRATFFAVFAADVIARHRQATSSGISRQWVQRQG